MSRPRLGSLRKILRCKSVRLWPRFSGVAPEEFTVAAPLRSELRSAV
jgi:hypothetical protein